MNDTERQRLDVAEAALRELTRRLTAMEQGDLDLGGEGFRIGTLRLFEKLVSPAEHDSEHHLHQRDEDGAESDLTGARSLQGKPISSTAPTTSQVLVYNATTNEWEPASSSTPGAHKDSHDPHDGSDKLDTAAAASIAGVQSAGAGSAHSFARSDHAHGIAHSKANNALVTIDDADAAVSDYLKITAGNGVEGRSAAQVMTDLPAATASAPGKVELATIAETQAGTDTGRVVTPDGLHGRKRIVYIKCLAHGTALTTGDGKVKWTVPSDLTGFDLVDADAAVYTASSAGGNGAVGPIQVYNVTDGVDMLSTGITLDQDELNSYTANTQPVIDTGNDDVVTGDVLRIDVDTAAGTGTKGLDVILVFQEHV